MEFEKLLYDKEDLEVTIQDLHKVADELEEIKNKSFGLAHDKTKQFLKEVEKEIEWNEQILDEIKEGIEFFELHKDK